MTTKQNLCRFAMLCLLLFAMTSSNAQFLDSLQVTAGLRAQLASKDYMPFWLVSNRYGTVADRQSDLSPYLRVYNKHVLAESEYSNDRGYFDAHQLTLSYGASIYNNNHFQSTFAEELFAKLEFKNWSLRAGRFEETSGDIDPELSTGSLGVSNNALPIPKIGIAVTDYTNVPFTAGWLQFRGTFAHGWLGTDRFARNSYYHEKTFFLRVGPGKLKAYAGIEHFAEWGGKTSEQEFDKSMKGFWNVMFAKGMEDNTPGTLTNPRAGDERGVIDAGLYWENDNIALHGYLQKPFEGKHDISLHNQNMLAGLLISMKENYIGLQKILFEVIATNSINTHIPVQQRESYYNNNIYKTGWEYKDHVVGTPLFINRSRAQNYFPEIQPFDWNAAAGDIPGNANIVNNRVFGFHLGALYSLSGNLDSKTLLTFTQNSGTLSVSDQFAPHRNQFYGLQQFSYDIPDKNISVSVGIGLDMGQLSHTLVGGLLAIEWNIIPRKNTDDIY